MIRPNKLDRRSSIYAQTACVWQGYHPGSASTEYIAAAAVGAVGTFLAGDTFVCIAPVSLFFTAAGATGGDTFSLKITGKDQFGDTAVETVSLTAAALTTHSVYCYSQVDSIEVTEHTGTGETCDVGTSNVVGTKIPMWAKNCPQGVVRGFGFADAAITRPTATVNTTYSNITLSNNVAAGGGHYFIYLEPDYAAYL